MVIYVANLKSIDSSLYEAASIDGASGIQQFFRVTLPLLYPSVSFNVLMSLIGGMKMSDAVFVMTKGGPGYATLIIVTVVMLMPIYYLLVTTFKTPAEASASPLGLPKTLLLIISVC